MRIFKKPLPGTYTRKAAPKNRANYYYEETTIKKEKSRLWERRCNFSLLEEKVLEYSQVLEIKKTTTNSL